VIERTGRIDGLVNNAGGSILGALEETSAVQAQACSTSASWRDPDEPGRPSCHARARFGAYRERQLGPGFMPGPYMALYSATKHALEGLSESLDHEVRGFGVRVVIVQPAFTRTNIDAASARGERPIDAYAAQRTRVVATIGEQISQSPEADTVARVIERALEAPGFARLPVGGHASLLSRLRRWMPPSMVDSSLRKNFQLDA
jgi:short-subunit dehydrogenase